MIHSGGIRGLIIASVTLHRDSVPRMSRDRRQTTADGGIQRHLIDIGMSDVSAGRRPVSPFTNECPRQDSNLRTRLRLAFLNVAARLVRHGRRLHMRFAAAYAHPHAFAAALTRIRALPAFG